MVERDRAVRRGLGRRRRALQARPGGAHRAVRPSGVPRRDLPPAARGHACPRRAQCLVWGDARLSNLIYRDFEVAAVLDWEMSGIGDPLLDLGWWLFADGALTTGSAHDREKL
ncbi:MAG TPA: phosphotransferase [Acidimicrobiales bacterium]|nr:phosphotransferase [Acidimicrobiales bacterium]